MPSEQPSPNNYLQRQRQGIVEQPRQPENQISNSTLARGIEVLSLVNEVLQQLQTASSTDHRAYSPPSFPNFVMMMKELGTTRFKGEPNMFEAIAWLENIERDFEVTECPEELKKKIAVFFLDENAKFWWSSIERQNGNLVQSWEEFRNKFERRYFPVEALERQFMELEQGEKNVREYEAEFTRLRQYVFLWNNNETALVWKFLQGLKPEIGSRLQAVTFTSLFELTEKAVNVEEAISAEKELASQGRSDNNKRSTRGHQIMQSTGRKQSKKQRRKQAKKSNGHINCFRCGGKGHFATSCSEPRRVLPPPERPALMPPPKRQAMDALASYSGNEDPIAGMEA